MSNQTPEVIIEWTGAQQNRPSQGSDTLVYIDAFSVTIVPEPATFGLIRVGLVGLLWFRRR